MVEESPRLHASFAWCRSKGHDREVSMFRVVLAALAAAALGTLFSAQPISTNEQGVLFDKEPELLG